MCRPPTVNDAREAAGTLPGTVILGGSVARGDAHGGSDIDLLHVVDIDPQPDTFFDVDVMGTISETVRFPVSVITIDWPAWMSRVKVPTTIESSALREGVLLKWVRPGPDVDWRRVKTAGRVWNDQVKFALRLIGGASRLLRAYLTVNTRYAPSGDLRDDSIALGQVNSEAHYLAERAFLLLCHLTGVPFRNRARLLEIIGDLPPATRRVVETCWTFRDIQWVEKWRKAGYWDPEHPPEDGELMGRHGTVLALPERYETRSGTSYETGTSQYARLVAEVTARSLEHAGRRVLPPDTVCVLEQATRQVGRVLNATGDPPKAPGRY